MVIRVITGEYSLPLGVWVCREAARRAMRSLPVQFAEDNLMVKYASLLLTKKFGFDAASMLCQSRLLREARRQTRLGRFG